ncbi:MAG: class I SAM-dependent methyltransferase [Hyphomicrobiaceae bacterium]
MTDASIAETVARPGALAQLGFRPSDRPYENTRSLPFRFRQGRFRHVRALIDTVIAEKGSARIIDIGGTEQYWAIARDYLAGKPVEIHLVNLEKADVAGAPFLAHAGDATRLGEFDDMSFDIVHSNSVIEHVGSWANMMAMADNVRRLAPRYYVQTPDFWSPVEPHFRAFGWHWLPEQVRARRLMRRGYGFRGRASSMDEAMRSIQGCALIDRRQLAALFPDARILAERVLGLPKSLMAIRDR